MFHHIDQGITLYMGILHVSRIYNTKAYAILFLNETALLSLPQRKEKDIFLSFFTLPSLSVVVVVYISF